MRALNLTHLSDPALKREMHSVVSRERGVTAEALAYIAEFDARRLYLADGYPSMFAYCVHEMHYSDDAAYKRIQAARAARQFSAIFDAVAEGRLHLSAVVLLAPHLTPENSDELIAAATHKTKKDIELLIALRFPKTELMPLVQAIGGSLARDEFASGEVDTDTNVRAKTHGLAPGQVENSLSRSSVKPLAPERFALQFTISKSTHDTLEYAQALLSHRIPSGDVAQVFDRALKTLVQKLEKQKFAATTKPRPRVRPASSNARHIPAHVKRAVWQRDQGQCTFIAENGRRCRSRKFLEFDHIDPVARGGQATVEGMRLRCRGHNQYEAEQVFGAEFMKHKREEAQRVAADARAKAAELEERGRAEAAHRAAEAEARSRAAAEANDVTACLRNLGFRAEETRRAAAHCAAITNSTLEERVRVALKYLCPSARVLRPVGASQGATM